MKIYGRNCLYEAIRNKAKLENIYVLDTAIKKEKNFVSLLDKAGYKYRIADKKEMQKVFGNKHQGFGAVREDFKYSELSILYSEKKAKRVLILDSVEDPQNLGSILRSSDAFGVDAIVIPKNRSVEITEVVARVSMGAIEYVPIIKVNNLVSAIKELKAHDFWIIGTDASFTTTASDIDKDMNLAVVIGSEGFGIGRLIKKECDYLLSIPMKGHVNSLNAAVSAAIVINQLYK